MQLNLTDSDEIFQTSNLRLFLNLTEISWRLAPLLQNHERISLCHCVSLSVSLWMLIWARKMTGFRWNYSIPDWNECYNHRSCLKRFGEVCSCHHCQISRGLPKERAPFHKQWPLRPRLSSLRPEKRPTFCWWNVKMHFIQRQCCILTKFMLVTESTCIFFKYRHVFIQGTNLFPPESRERKLDFQFLTYVRSSVCRMKSIGVIFIQFIRNDQLRIL